MKIVFEYTLVLLLVISSSYCQQVEMKSYDLNNNEGISKIQFGIYKEPYQEIKVGEYTSLSQVKNATIEELLKSELSENSLEWKIYNHDAITKKDSLANYQKLFNQRKQVNLRFIPFSLLLYELNGVKRGNLVVCMLYGKNHAPLNTIDLIWEDNRWKIQVKKEKFIKDLNSFEYSQMLTKSVSFERILSQRPVLEGERLVVEQCTDANGKLNMRKLGELLWNLETLAKTSPAYKEIFAELGSF